MLALLRHVSINRFETLKMQVSQVFVGWFGFLIVLYSNTFRYVYDFCEVEIPLCIENRICGNACNCCDWLSLKETLVLLVMQGGIFNRLQHDDKENTFLKNPTFRQRYC